MRTIEDIAAYQQRYKQKIRAISLPAHDYVRPTHCRQCFRAYNAATVARYRQRQKQKNNA